MEGVLTMTDPWEDESGFLTNKAKQWIENRAVLSDEDLINIHRELDAVTRLLNGELYWSGRGQPVGKVALAASINYGQTPIQTYGYIPPAEISIKLSCILVEDEDKVRRSRARYSQSLSTNPGINLNSVPDLEFDFNDTVG
jgi:hypothetical protein